MAVSKSSLSAGEIIRAILMADSEVVARSKKVFPVVEDSAELPYIVYRRTQLEQVPTKAGRGADTVGIEVLCYTEHYTEGVELAEAVRGALDGAQGESDGLVMRSCYLADSEEAWQDDAYVQQLVFNVKI
ncbi:DUF3168 domain-containing protein [uncultured Bacteroides sp.]|uniref:tail completion protein gp17 n=1 Tax=uncultured Bacteroides sp. TaxID=162156 RepID=UPI0025FF9719|nr:DUF3168 domain-containing protein [uncultured Bacteroides sp.]